MNGQHRPPRVPARLPGSFWGITAYFNPVHYANRLPNYRLFRESLKSQGLPLAAVELVHDDAPFELQESDAEILVQRRGGDVLWQKERLLNVALEHLPGDCDKVVWVDADVLFENRHWVADTAALLEQFVFVQPFSLAFRLEAGCTSVGDPHVARPGSAFCWSRRQGWYGGMPGLAMSSRREVLKAHGLYDRLILGAADRVILSAAMGIDAAQTPDIRQLPASLVADARKWASRVAAAAHGSLHYTEGNLFHLWHGTVAGRRYTQQPRLLQEFEVHEDIRVDPSGAWAWATDKPAMHARIRRYFLSRNEDGRSRVPWWRRWLAPL